MFVYARMYITIYVRGTHVLCVGACANILRAYAYACVYVCAYVCVCVCVCVCLCVYVCAHVYVTQYVTCCWMAPSPSG